MAYAFGYSFHDDEHDSERAELAAEARAERRRLGGHWCAECHGHTGPNSPCYAGDEEPEDDEPAEDDEEHFEHPDELPPGSIKPITTPRNERT